ncbi:MAG: hypothetical protein ABR587_06655 [Candidatus Binatia bacterium]
MTRPTDRKHRTRAPRHRSAATDAPALVPVPARPAASAPKARTGFLPAVVVAVAALLAYSNAAPPVTVHDDAFFVPARHDLSASSVRQIFSEDTWASTGSPAGTYRPLTILSIAVNGAMFGNDPAGYHATNIALHALASLLVYFLLVSLLGAAQAWPCALAATLFAVHPIHTEAVDSVFNRSEILATTGVVGALVAISRWHEARPVLAWTVASVLYLAALLCRESAVTLPVLAALMLWFTHSHEPLRPRIRRVLPVAVLALALAEYFVLRQHGLSSQTQAVAPVLGVETGQDLASRFVYSIAALGEYARMMVWPWPLRISYENFSGDSIVAAAAVHTVLLGTAFALRRALPMAAFAVAFFYVALLPSTRLFTALGEALQLGGEVVVHLQNSLLVGERVAYLPSVALAMGVAVVLAVVARRHGLALAAAGAALPIAAGFLVTMDRNRDWHSATELFAAEVKAAPENVDGWRLFVSALSNAGRYNEAAAACDAQLERPGRSAQLFNNCGVVYDRLQRDEPAIRAYQRAIEQGLTTVGHANLGRVYARIGRMEEAEAEFVASAQSENDPARRHYRNGLTLARFHPDRKEEARREFQAALALQPDFTAARAALARLGS